MHSPISARLLSLDLVRGTALLGILLLNIVGFGMPEAAYFNPRAYGGWHGADLVAWLVNLLFFDGRMRGLFSFLFGASLLIVTDAAEAAGRDPARAHYARMGWLLLFGLAHLWLVWHGDILAHYALVGMLAFPLRKLPVARLLSLGAVLVLATTAVFGMLAHDAWRMSLLPPQVQGEYTALVDAFGVPPASRIAAELAIRRGDYAGVVGQRFGAYATSPFAMLTLYGWETLGYMLFGMAALRSGLLTGAWPRETYRRWWLRCWAIALPIYVLLAIWLIAAKFGLFAVLMAAVTLPGLIRPVMILGWACLILYVARPDGWLTRRVAAAGRMAFSNYLATSLLCVWFFDGYGLGWFGHLSRWQLYPVVLGVWALLLLWSQPWLTAFRYGPLEWLWRSLARGSLQPIRNSLANRSQSH
ncbi:uncharacterized protein SAMN03159338_4123 [Sphingomonas sp. NFR04]|uniref:DUF418 domain-containing protein n=1 Tax=Sphingomonas sp. NFR04 TaxID=1566283 RepID=UPI0008E89F6F|nr:DUF418 domain-containing protein [Sphingomonas sp. NFR04]SFK40844.1 uncharacterized protein SAMN03159338_4123 [Sphingomonas sp. NFR04]